MATYDKDDRVRVTATFTSGGTDANTDAVATHRKPDTTDTTLSTTNSATGIYYANVDLDQIGTHTIKFTGTTPVKAMEVVELKVGKSVFDHA
jgi:hypothetical protein